MASVAENGEESQRELRLPCSVCCRKFAPDVLDRHEKICEKMAQKKRKAFDSAKQRIMGTDIPTVQSAPPNIPSGRKSPERKARPAALRLTRTTKNTPSVTLVNRLNSAFVQCPSCDRNFSEKAADRHIPWCKEQKARIPRSPPSTVAKHRLTARIQYKAPTPGKRRASPPRHSPNTYRVRHSPVSQRKSSNPTAVSPMSPLSVKVTGTALWKLPRQNGGGASSNNGCVVNKPTSNSGSLSSLINNNGYDGNFGMSPSTSWEFFSAKKSPALEVDQQQQRKAALERNGGAGGKNDQTYDPFETAQRQLEELRLGRPPSPQLSPNPIRDSVMKEDFVVEGIKPRSHHSSSAWSLDSDKDLEDIEEDIVFDEANLEDDVAAMFPPSFPPPHPPQLRDRAKHPRRTVSREEALFGSKHSSGSLDSDYGSMLRRSPSTPAHLSPSQRHASHTYVEPLDRIHCSSRSSSETSLPLLGAGGDHQMNHGDGFIKVARFCHECGAQYPVLNAKFCCECGIRRMCVT